VTRSTIKITIYDCTIFIFIFILRLKNKKNKKKIVGATPRVKVKQKKKKMKKKKKKMFWLLGWMKYSHGPQGWFDHPQTGRSGGGRATPTFLFF
jgi:hypothetical protein